MEDFESLVHVRWECKYHVVSLISREVGVQGSGFGGQDSGVRVQGSGFRGRGSGFRVQGSEEPRVGVWMLHNMRIAWLRAMARQLMARLAYRSAQIGP
jgi:hypothetical protein